MALRLNQPITIGSVRVELIGAGELRLTGTLSDPKTEQELSRHLRTLHDSVVADKLPALTVDVRRLAFVNSSAIRLFVDLASRAESAGYILIFDIDSSITWHRLSFSVLVSLAPKSVRLRSHAQMGARFGT
jgi:anti-anti-sigma regulatory factor